jgi:hypothetical protein
MFLALCFRKINRLYILKYGKNVGYIILHHAPRIKACPPSQAFRNYPQSLQRNVGRKSISPIRQRCKLFISIPVQHFDVTQTQPLTENTC